MLSLDSIPEPSNNAPSVEPTDAAQLPLTPATTEEQSPTATAPPSEATAKDDGDQQVDSVAVLLLLLIAGALLRIVLGLLGPMQGIDTQQIQQAQAHGKAVLAGEPNNAYPLFDLIASAIASTGMPAWVLVLLGSLVTLASIPAAFIIGLTLTGRRTPGIVAGAILAVHPAVLTVSNSFASPAIAIGLITIGFASLCFIERKGASVAITGGVLLGLAGLAAPLCGLIGVLAGPVVYKLARRRGAAKAMGLAVLVTLLAAAPAVTYRAAFFGVNANALLTEWNPENLTAHTPGPMDRLLVTMTHPSFNELGEAMHLPLGDAGRLKITHTAAPATPGERDVVADTLADGWLLLNAALAGLAVISIGVLIARRRLAETLVLAVPLTAMAFCTLAPSETLRLPLIAMVGVLATGLFATRSVPTTDEAAKQAKRLEKLAKREEKERAKQDRELSKHKAALHDFDRPTRAEKQQQKKQAKRDADDSQEAILTEHQTEAPSLGARPI